jgi:hypothetical protein
MKLYLVIMQSKKMSNINDNFDMLKVSINLVQRQRNVVFFPLNINDQNLLFFKIILHLFIYNITYFKADLISNTYVIVRVYLIYALHCQELIFGMCICCVTIL